MNINLTTLKHPQLGAIRTLEIEGEPWFAAPDVATALGYKNHQYILKSYVSDEHKRFVQKKKNPDLASQIPSYGLTIVDQKGLYSLLCVKQNLLEKQFKNWIDRDVLPTLRKHNKPVQNDDNASKPLKNISDMDENRSHMPELVPIEQEGQRVLSTSQLAEAYETTEQVITNNFNRNKERYAMGKHYFLLEGDALKDFKATTNQIELSSIRINKLYLWTERGALLHAKSLNTDKAWKVYDYLVETYFRMQEAPRFDVDALSPGLQKVKALSATLNTLSGVVDALFESMARTEIEWKRQAAEQTKKP